MFRQRIPSLLEVFITLDKKSCWLSSTFKPMLWRKQLIKTNFDISVSFFSHTATQRKQLWSCFSLESVWNCRDRQTVPVPLNERPQFNKSDLQAEFFTLDRSRTTWLHLPLHFYWLDMKVAPMLSLKYYVHPTVNYCKRVIMHFTVLFVRERLFIIPD